MPTIVISPVLPEEPEEVYPCEQLGKMLDPQSPSNIKDDIEALQQGIQPQGEDGISIKKEGNEVYGIDQLNPTITRSIPIPTGKDTPTIYGAVHTHPFSTYPMFSFADLFVLMNLHFYASISNKGEVVFMLVCKDDQGNDQVYALKIDDYEAFRAKVYQELNEVVNSSPFLNQNSPIGDMIAEADNVLKKDYIFADNAQTGSYETAFIDFFQDFNVSLFKADPALTSWSYLFDVDIESNSPIELPCDN